MLASSDRPIRFVIDARYYNMRLLKPFLTLLRAIPMPLGAGPKPLLRALRDAGKLLDEGEVVCIFPEGQITRTGMLGSFQRGFQRIVGDRDVPIIPVAIDRVWGSIFSRSGGRFVTKMPRPGAVPNHRSIWRAAPGWDGDPQGASGGARACYRGMEAAQAG